MDGTNHRLVNYFLCCGKEMPKSLCLQLRSLKETRRMTGKMRKSGFSNIGPWPTHRWSKPPGHASGSPSRIPSPKAQIEPCGYPSVFVSFLKSHRTLLRDRSKLCLWVLTNELALNLDSCKIHPTACIFDEADAARVGKTAIFRLWTGDRRFFFDFARLMF